MTRRRIFLILSIIWMSIIFYFSNQVASVSSAHSGGVINTLSNVFIIGDIVKFMESIDIAEFVVRKSAHMFVYLVLAILIFMSIYEKNDTKEIYLKSMFFTFLYAVSDEIHQRFVEGRSGEVRDIFVDSFGAFLGLLIVYFIFRKIEKRAKSN